MAEQTSDIGEQLATIERKPAKERAPDYSRLQATVGKELGAAETGLKKAEIDVGIAQKEAGTRALREQIGLEEKELEAGRERVSRYELPTFTPSQETLTDYARLGSMVMTLGLMLGKGAKDSGLTALNAMSGLLQGWKQGRKDVYERELKKFDKEFQRIKEIRNSIEKDIQRAIQLWPTKRQEAIAAAESAAYKAGSGSIIEYYAKTGQLKKAQELIASSKKTTDEIVKQQARIDEIKAREDAADRRFKMRYDQAERLAKTRRDEKALQSIGPALRNIAEQYAEGTEKTLFGASPNDKKRIEGSFRAVEESESVADFVARNPRAVGALAVAKNFLRIDAIKSLKSDNESAVASGKAAIIDQQIDNAVAKGQISKDDAESAKVLQKKLFGLALSDVQGSGQRGSVYLDRQFQNLYDQASRQETLLKIIREREEENNRNLRIYKLNVERNKNPENFPLYEADTPERFNQYLKKRSPKKIASKQDIQDTARGQKISDEEAKKRLRALGYQIEGEQ